MSGPSSFGSIASSQTPLGSISHNHTSVLPPPTSTQPPILNSIDDGASPLRWFLVTVVQTDDTEDNMKRWSSFIGICIAIAGNVLISLALNVQKYAHTRLEREAERKRAGRLRTPLKRVSSSSNGSRNSGSSDEDMEVEVMNGGTVNETSALLAGEDEEGKKDEDEGNYIASPYWWAGLIMMFFGECGNFLAYGFAPASIVSPLGVVALVSNCVVAPLMLKEPFRGRDVVGVLVSIAGAVTVVWSAETEEAKLGPDEILRAISQTAFEVYFGITVTMILVLMRLSSTHGHKSICIDLGLVALFGGYTVLSTKGISSLISSSFYHIFQYPIAYLFTFTLTSTAILQVKYVNRALQRFDSTQVIPTQFVLFTLSVIVGSAILYRDFETVGQDRLFKFVSGCALTFVGVYLISSQRETRPPATKSVPGQSSADLTSDSYYDEDPEAAHSLPPTPVVHTKASLDAHFSAISRSPQSPLPRSTSQVSSNAVSVVSTPALATSPPQVIPHTPQRSRRPSKSGPSRTPVNLIPGVMAGYQLGGVIKERVSGTFRSRVTGGDGGVSDGGQGGRGRSSSLSVVLDFMKGRRGSGPSQPLLEPGASGSGS